MNDTTATIKQLSAELHVSEQALRSWCKRNEIQKTTKGKITSYFLSANDVELIRKHYTEQRKQTHNESESKAQRKENNYVSLLSQTDTLKAQLAERDKQLDELTAQLTDKQTELSKQAQTIDELKAELAEKDKETSRLQLKVNNLSSFNTLHHKTIDRLEQDNKKLNDRLDKAETERESFLNNISELTIALKAAQALHGMDKQQATIELKETTEQVAADQSEQPERKSLFARLFRRSK